MMMGTNENNSSILYRLPATDQTTKKPLSFIPAPLNGFNDMDLAQRNNIVRDVPVSTFIVPTTSASTYRPPPFIPAPVNGFNDMGWAQRNNIARENVKNVSESTSSVPTRSFIPAPVNDFNDMGWAQRNNITRDVLESTSSVLTTSGTTNKTLSFIPAPVHGFNNIGWAERNNIARENVKNVSVSTSSVSTLSFIPVAVNGFNDMGWTQRNNTGRDVKNVPESLSSVPTNSASTYRPLSFIPTPVNGFNDMGWTQRNNIARDVKNISESTSSVPTLSFIPAPVDGFNDMGWVQRNNIARENVKNVPESTSSVPITQTRTQPTPFDLRMNAVDSVREHVRDNVQMPLDGGKPRLLHYIVLHKPTTEVSTNSTSGCSNRTIHSESHRITMDNAHGYTALASSLCRLGIQLPPTFAQPSSLDTSSSQLQNKSTSVIQNTVQNTEVNLYNQQPQLLQLQNLRRSEMVFSLPPETNNQTKIYTSSLITSSNQLQESTTSGSDNIQNTGNGVNMHTQQHQLVQLQNLRKKEMVFSLPPGTNNQTKTYPYPYLKAAIAPKSNLVQKEMSPKAKLSDAQLNLGLGGNILPGTEFEYKTPNSTNLNRSGNIKRPMNPFMVWARNYRGVLANQMKNASNAEISVKLGQLWNEMESNEKNKYYLEADRIKNQHKRDYPGWVYRPRAQDQTQPVKQEDATHNMLWARYNSGAYPSASSSAVLARLASSVSKEPGCSGGQQLTPMSAKHSMAEPKSTPLFASQQTHEKSSVTQPNSDGTATKKPDADTNSNISSSGTTKSVVPNYCPKREIFFDQTAQSGKIEEKSSQLTEASCSRAGAQSRTVKGSKSSIESGEMTVMNTKCNKVGKKKGLLTKDVSEGKTPVKEKCSTAKDSMSTKISGQTEGSREKYSGSSDNEKCVNRHEKNDELWPFPFPTKEEEGTPRGCRPATGESRKELDCLDAYDPFNYDYDFAHPETLPSMEIDVESWHQYLDDCEQTRIASENEELEIFLVPEHQSPDRQNDFDIIPTPAAYTILNSEGISQSITDICAESGIIDGGTNVGSLTRVSSDLQLDSCSELPNGCKPEQESSPGFPNGCKPKQDSLSGLPNGCKPEQDYSPGFPNDCKPEQETVRSEISDNSDSLCSVPSVTEKTSAKCQKESTSALKNDQIENWIETLKPGSDGSRGSDNVENGMVKEEKIEIISIKEEPEPHERFSIPLNGGAVEIFYVTDNELTPKGTNGEPPHIEVDHEEIIDTRGRNDYILQHRKETLRSFARAKPKTVGKQPSQQKNRTAKERRDSTDRDKNKLVTATTPIKRRLSSSKKESKRR